MDRLGIVPVEMPVEIAVFTVSTVEHQVDCLHRVCRVHDVDVLHTLGGATSTRNPPGRYK